MHTFVALWLFYKKLILPSLVLSILLAFLGATPIKFSFGVGIAYMFLTPALHLLFYDMSRPNEYYFYANLGISKFNLWVNTVVVSLAIGLILMMI
ncbi:hypothetical protein WG904_15475 [Pedobacter sp. Du54]|uniref:hypothetical protein n=1 Tax=Pedobacter anseongensis TaxID=3133439 RepID=UPI0030985301